MSRRLTRSDRREERIYSARSCASIARHRSRATGTSTREYATAVLRRALAGERDPRVRYEISRGLAALGEWSPATLDELCGRLEQCGYTAGGVEILRTLASGDDDGVRARRETSGRGPADGEMVEPMRKLEKVGSFFRCLALSDRELRAVGAAAFRVVFKLLTTPTLAFKVQFSEFFFSSKAFSCRNSFATSYKTIKLNAL